MDNGWIKLHRKVLDNGWLQNPKLWIFWCYCLLKASHKKHSHFVGFQRVDLLPGQFVFGLEKASIDLKMSIQSIRTCLKNLEMYGNLTRKITSKYSIITVCNWSSYQDIDNNNQQAKEQTTNKQLTIKQQATNNKQECNNDNNEKKKEVKHIHGEYKHVRLTEKEYEKLQADFNSKLPDMIKNLDEAIEQYGYKYSNHNLTLRKWEKKDNNGNSGKQLPGHDKIYSNIDYEKEAREWKEKIERDSR